MKSLLRIFIVCLFYICWKSILGENLDSLVPRQKRQVTISVSVLPNSFSPEAVRVAFQVASENIAQRRNIAAAAFVPTRPSAPQGGSPTFRHNLFQRSKERSRQLERTQEIFEEATNVLHDQYNLSAEEVTSVLEQMDLTTVLEDNLVDDCRRLFEFECDPSVRFRTYDGTCNNLENPSWGMASVCFERLLNPVYHDGVSELRRSRSGRELPRPRTISLEIHNHMDIRTDYVTHMFMQFGQFLDHDISLSPLEQQEGQPLNCCPVNNNNNAQCGPIVLGPDDPFYSALGIDCLNNARTVICSTCHLGPRQQTNQLTAFIDASQIYGTSQNETNGLRNFDNSGTLRSMNNVNSGELLPPSSMPANDGCSFQMRDLTCFEAGDPRVNQHLALTSLHTIFLRHHNRIARQLRSLNPRWNDERLFQETRRIVGAQLQMITYNEFLPLVIGQQKMEWFDLCIQHRTVHTQYDPTVQPTLVNEFSTAAFRFGHSTINSFFPDVSYYRNSGNRLRDLFLWPFGLYNGELEGTVRGLFQSPAQKFDRHMVRDVTNHLYELRNNQSGLDLASLNLFRGRDHGIPPYVDLVRFCGGPDITSFRQLDRQFQRGYRQLFQRVYEYVEDIDLFSGGLAERPIPGAVVGPTFACIIGIQFHHLKYGDRFYFEHGEQVGSFSPEQLRELKRTTLAKIICDNSEIDIIQRNVMLYSSQRNPQLRCRDLPSTDLRYWQEQNSDIDWIGDIFEQERI